MPVDSSPELPRRLQLLNRPHVACRELGNGLGLHVCPDVVDEIASVLAEEVDGASAEVEEEWVSIAEGQEGSADSKRRTCVREGDGGNLQ